MSFLRRARLHAERCIRGRRFGASASDAPNPVLPLHIVQKPEVQKTLPFVGNAAYLMLAGGFMCTDVLWLRLVLGGGYAGLVCYHGFQLRPLRIPLCGSAFFVCVNAYKAFVIVQDRYVTLSDEETKIYDGHFKDSLSPAEFKKLMSCAEVVSADKRTELVTKGKVADLVLIVEGQADVSVGGGVSVKVEQSGLIGEVSFLNGGTASATAFATPGCRYVIWRRDELFKKWLDQEPAVKKGLEHKIGRELTHKLECTTAQLVDARTR